jgi:arylsulfatase A
VELTRREFIAGAAALAGRAHPRAAQERPGAPNILLLLADDLGRECLRSYGGSSYKTPRLDALAQTGLRFERCFAMPQCHPSRVTLLTGRYPFRTNARWGTLPAAEVTLAQALARAGYATAVSGKWQLARLADAPDHPARAGFATSCCWGWNEGPRYVEPVIWQDGRLRADVRDRYGPDVHTDFLIEFMARREPFLAYYPLTLPHLSSDGADAARPASYAQLVAELDRQVGRTLDALDALGLAERTLVLFSADNGSPRSVISLRDGRPVRGGKSLATDAGTHVPLLARWPGVVPAGVCRDLVDLSDFFPTLLELAGAELPAGVPLDGRSFAPQLRGERGAPRAWVYSGHRSGSFLREERWKLTREGALHDLARDPDEAAPIAPGADTPESAAARARLRAHVSSYFPGGELP